MSQNEIDRVAFDSFMLAMRVIAVAFEIDEPASKFERPFELLKNIAAGEETVTSPAELGVRFPGLKELMYDAASTLMQNDRATAARILRGLGSI